MAGKLFRVPKFASTNFAFGHSCDVGRLIANLFAAQCDKASGDVMRSAEAPRSRSEAAHVERTPVERTPVERTPVEPTPVEPNIGNSNVATRNVVA
jgi:hypothetical protein